jgi:hypothetical protein
MNNYSATITVECPYKGHETRFFQNSPTDTPTLETFDCPHKFVIDITRGLVCRTIVSKQGRMRWRFCPVFWDHFRAARYAIRYFKPQEQRETD